MNTPRDDLRRLLLSASTAPADPLPPLKGMLERRVLAALRASRDEDRDTAIVTSVLLRAAFCATVIAIASVGWNWPIAETYVASNNCLARYALNDFLLP